MVVIHKRYGHIIGGVCDKAHKRRRAREVGAEMYWQILLEGKFVKRQGNKVLIKKLADTTFARHLGNGSIELGIYRLSHYLASKIGKTVSMKKINELIGGELTSKEGVFNKQPHQDALYRRRRAEGDRSIEGE